MHPPVLDERYRALTSVDVLGLVLFAAPVTQSFRAVLKPGDVVRVAQEPAGRATSIYVLPEDELGREADLVPVDYREDSLYAGYVLTLKLEDLARDFELLGPRPSDAAK